MILVFKFIRRCFYLLDDIYIFILINYYKGIYKGQVSISNDLKFGEGFKIILDVSKTEVKIGASVLFRKNCEIRIGDSGKLTIGNNNFFNNNFGVTCLSLITIGSNNQFGENVKIYDHNHSFSDFELNISEQGYSKGSIAIGNNCWIGSNVTVLKSVNIGDNCVIGAGCTIFKSVPSGTILINKQNLIVKERK